MSCWQSVWIRLCRPFEALRFWTGAAHVVLCTFDGLSNASHVFPLEILRSHPLDLSLKLDCDANIAWQQRLEAGRRWSLDMSGKTKEKRLLVFP